MGTPQGRARPSRETRAERSAVPARVCRPGRGHNGAAARCGTGVPGELDTPDKDAGRREKRSGGRFAAARRHHGGWGGLCPGARPRFPSARVPESSRILPGARPRLTPEPAPNALGARPRSSPKPTRDAPRSRPWIPWSWSLSRCAPRGTGQVPLESARVRSALPARRRAHRRGRTRPGAGSRAPIRSQSPSQRFA